MNEFLSRSNIRGPVSYSADKVVGRTVYNLVREFLIGVVSDGNSSANLMFLNAEFDRFCVAARQQIRRDNIEYANRGIAPLRSLVGEIEHDNQTRYSASNTWTDYSTTRKPCRVMRDDEAMASYVADIKDGDALLPAGLDIITMAPSEWVPPKVDQAPYHFHLDDSGNMQAKYPLNKHF